MKFPADAPVQPKKLADLRERISALELDLAGVDEKAIASGGSGGQKRNKTASAIVLRHGDRVLRCQQSRSKALNRFLALRRLVEELEAERDGSQSKEALRLARLRKQKARRRRRSASQPADGSGAETGAETGD